MQAAHIIPLTNTRPRLELIEGGAPFRDALASSVPGLTLRARRLCRDRPRADDLVHDTVERALRFEENFTKGTNLQAWLYTIMHNLFVSRCRKEQRERLVIGTLAVEPEAERRASATGFSKTMASALAALKPSFREALMLVDVAELSYREAAVELGVPVGTIMSRLYRARQALRTQLDRIEAREEPARAPTFVQQRVPVAAE